MERMTEAKQATESERTAETGRVAEMKKAVDEARTFGYEKLMQDCALCPRACHVNRLSGRTGYCGQTSRIYAARRRRCTFGRSPVSPERRAPARYFSAAAPLRCVFCQNSVIAEGGVGQQVGVEQLSEILLRLQGEGANNINLVTPTHFVPQIAAALRLAKRDGLRIPVVYNTGSYERVETLRLLDGLVDIYLPDLKYGSPEPAERYSHAPDYFETASAAIAEMVRQVPEAVFEEREDGTVLMKRGVIVRHLMLPGLGMDSGRFCAIFMRPMGTGFTSAL